MIDINTNALKEYSQKLGTLSRSALPVAVRESLNDCARDMKMNTLMKTSADAFINRSPNFFKANSAYDKANGFDISDMRATVGMTEDNIKGDPKKQNASVRDLEEQETAGDIKRKGFIPMLAARKGGARSLIRPNARLQKIKNVVVSSKMGGEHARQNFVLAVFKAGKGGYVLSKKILWKVNSLRLTKTGDFKLTPLYSYEKGRSVHVKAHHFVNKAGYETHKKIDDYYIKRAEIAFEKHLR